MIKQVYIKVFVMLSLFGISLSSCTSLSKTKLSSDPGFVSNAEKYSMFHEYPQPFYIELNRFQEITKTFIIENEQTKENFQIEVKYLSTTSETELIKNLKKKQDSESIDKIVKIAFAKMDTLSDLVNKDTLNVKEYNEGDYFYYAMVLHNPINDLSYCALSKIFFYRDRLEIEPSSWLNNNELIYPINFWIFEEDRKVGDFIFGQSQENFDRQTWAILFNIFLNEKSLNIDFQDLNYKRRVSIEHEDQLIAFLELKPPKAVAKGTYKNLTGKAMIKDNSSQEFTAEIFTTYILSDMAFNFFKEDPYNAFEETP